MCWPDILPFIHWWSLVPSADHFFHFFPSSLHYSTKWSFSLLVSLSLSFFLWVSLFDLLCFSFLLFFSLLPAVCRCSWFTFFSLVSFFLFFTLLPSSSSSIHLMASFHSHFACCFLFLCFFNSRFLLAINFPLTTQQYKHLTGSLSSNHYLTLNNISLFLATNGQTHIHTLHKWSIRFIGRKDDLFISFSLSSLASTDTFHLLNTLSLVALSLSLFPSSSSSSSSSRATIKASLQPICSLLYLIQLNSG